MHGPPSGVQARRGADQYHCPFVWPAQAPPAFARGSREFRRSGPTEVEPIRSTRTLAERRGSSAQSRGLIAVRTIGSLAVLPNDLRGNLEALTFCTRVLYDWRQESRVSKGV